MKKMRCGVAAVAALRAAGVSKVFGLMGSSTLEMYDALYDAKDIEYIGVRHENCGMHMADAYGRITQSPGVFMCGQAGPGSANMVLGLAQAKMAYSPVVAITAQLMISRMAPGMWRANRRSTKTPDCRLPPRRSKRRNCVSSSLPSWGCGGFKLQS